MMLTTAVAICELRFDDEDVERLRGMDPTKCSETESVLRQVLGNIEMYSRYLPERLKNRADSPETDEGENLPEVSDIVSSNTRNSSPSMPASASDLPSPRREAPSSVASLDAHALLPKKPLAQRYRNEAAFELGLSKRAATVMVCDVRSMHRLLEQENRSHDAVVSFSRAFDLLVDLAKQYQGSFEGIDGDKLVFMWNTVRNCVSHQHNAVCCAVRFLSFMKDVQFDSLDQSCLPLDFILTISSGDILYGVVGNETRRCIAVGRPCALAYAIKRALILPLPAGSYILVDDGVHEAVKYEYDAKIISTLEFQDRRTRVYRLGRPRESSSPCGEWLYQIASNLEEEAEPVVQRRQQWEGFWSSLEEGVASKQSLLVSLQSMLDSPDFVTTERADAEMLLRKIEKFEFDLVPKLD